MLKTVTPDRLEWLKEQFNIYVYPLDFLYGVQLFRLSPVSFCVLIMMLLPVSFS